MSKISHIEVYVSQYAKSIRFYDLVLIPMGWKRLVCQKSHTTYTDGTSKIVLCQTDSEYLSFGYHRKRTGLNHLAFFADSKSSVEDFYQNILLNNQIPCLYSGKPEGDSDYFSVFFEDPDRIKLEYVYAPGYCDSNHWTNRIASDFDPYSND